MLQAAEHFGWSNSQQVLKNLDDFTTLITDGITAHRSKAKVDVGATDDDQAALRVRPDHVPNITAPNRFDS